MKLDKRHVKRKSILGASLHIAFDEGRHDDLIKTIFSQGHDNFCLMLDTIGYNNMYRVFPDLCDKVNQLAQKLKPSPNVQP